MAEGLKAMFCIKFKDEPLDYPYEDTSIPAAPGMLQLGKTEEGFLSALELWDKKSYESHWQHELQSLLGGRRKVALVVSYNDPKTSPNLEMWPCYRDGDWVRIQNHLPWYDSFPLDFTISKISDFLSDRTVLNEDGNRLSEWSVTIQDIEEFLRTAR